MTAEDIKFNWLNTSVGGEDVFIASPKAWFGINMSPAKVEEEEDE